jgi:hypothetical protein
MYLVKKIEADLQLLKLKKFFKRPTINQLLWKNNYCSYYSRPYLCSNNEDKADGYGNFEAWSYYFSRSQWKNWVLNIEEGVLEPNAAIGLIDTIQLYLNKNNYSPLKLLFFKIKKCTIKLMFWNNSKLHWLEQKKSSEYVLGLGTGALKQSQSTFKILNAKINQKKK